MNVHGYDKEQDLVKIDLSIDKIIEARIDPWRLDLWDPAPVVLNVGGRDLYFRRLRDIAFMFRLPGTDNHACVIMGEDGTKLCITTRDAQSLESKDILSTEPISDEQFALHMRRYLEQLQLYNLTDLGSKRFLASSPVPASSIAFDLEQGYCPKHDAPELADYSPYYLGDMLAQRTFAAKLPDEINRLIVGLKRWRPIIYGKSLRRALRGEKIGELYLCMAYRGRDTLEKLLPDYRVTISGDNERMRLSAEKGSVIETVIATAFDEDPLEVVDPNKKGGAYSVNTIYCVKPNEINGPRIAFRDIAKKQARLLYCSNGDAVDRVCYDRMELDGKFAYPKENDAFYSDGYTALDSRRDNPQDD